MRAGRCTLTRLGGDYELDVVSPLGRLHVKILRRGPAHAKIKKADNIQKVVDLPDSLYQNSAALAASRGASLEQFIVEALKKEVQCNSGPDTDAVCRDHAAELPVIRSKAPGKLDLADFEFDDLLA